MFYLTSPNHVIIYANRSPDQRSDLYALGIIYYEMSTGQLPFYAQDMEEWVHAHLAIKPKSLKALHPEWAGPLDEMIMKLLAKEPEERYQSAYGLLFDLKRCLSSLKETGGIVPLVHPTIFPVPGLPKNIISVQAADNVTYILTSDGRIWEWGRYPYRSTTPTVNNNIDHVVFISAAGDYNYALKSDGTVWDIDQNLQVPLLDHVIAIQAESFYSGVALKSDGTVWTWGNNNYGQLGVETPTYTDTPVQVLGLPAIKDIKKTSYHTLALSITGSVYAWGYNLYGQVGKSVDYPYIQYQPYEVGGLVGIKQIGVGKYNSFAVNEAR